MNKATMEDKIQAVIEYIEHQERGMFVTESFTKMRDIVMYGYVKPCPFCGSVTAPDIVSSKEMGMAYGSSTEFAMCCDFTADGCGAMGGYRGTVDEAKANWNKREEA